MAANENVQSFEGTHDDQEVAVYSGLTFDDYDPLKRAEENSTTKKKPPSVRRGWRVQKSPKSRTNHFNLNIGYSQIRFNRGWIESRMQAIRGAKKGEKEGSH